LIIAKAARANTIATAIFLPLAAGVGFLFAGWPGVTAGALGVLLGFGFFLITAFSVTLVSSRAPSLVEAVVLGGWLIKLIIFILIFAGLRDVTWLNDVVFAVSVAVAALVGLVIEVWVVLRAKGTYVDPQ
jgi:hypothetical protein